MHRRPNTTAATTTTQNLTLNDGDHHTEEQVPVVSTSVPIPKRRKRKKTAFSMHFGSSIYRDDAIRIMAGIIFILVLLICVGVVTIFRLMSQKNVSIFPKTISETDQVTASDPSQNIPHSMSHIGDKSQKYADLRQDYEKDHPWDTERSLKVTEELIGSKYKTIQNGVYDIYNCPDEPPEGYPYQWNTVTILNNWNPNDVANPPSEIYQGICVFDYRRDYVKALYYRTKEVPFVVRNDPYVAAATERWNTPGYVEEMLGDAEYRAEYSDNNHFMYWNPGKKKKGSHTITGDRYKHKTPAHWTNPTEMIKMTYTDWLEHANVTDESLLGPDQPHWYFRLIGCGEMINSPMGKGQCHPPSDYLFDELTFFQPRPDLLYMVEPEQQKGIHCRFGMKGVIAENHFDSSRNSIVVLGGERRYILSHPDQCRNLALLPKGHPSARHSAVNWADPDLEKYPEFAEAKSNEVVLQAGDVLYLPTSWFHYIISLTLNFQCNTRSGAEQSNYFPIHECGF